MIPITIHCGENTTTRIYLPTCPVEGERIEIIKTPPFRDAMYYVTQRHFKTARTLTAAHSTVHLDLSVLQLIE